MASEIVGWGCKAKGKVVGVKVDFEKANDKLSWAFL